MKYWHGRHFEKVRSSKETENFWLDFLAIIFGLLGIFKSRGDILQRLQRSGCDWLHSNSLLCLLHYHGNSKGMFIINGIQWLVDSHAWHDFRFRHFFGFFLNTSYLCKNSLWKCFLCSLTAMNLELSLQFSVKKKLFSIPMIQPHCQTQPEMGSFWANQWLLFLSTLHTGSQGAWPVYQHFWNKKKFHKTPIHSLLILVYSIGFECWSPARKKQT